MGEESEEFKVHLEEVCKCFIVQFSLQPVHKTRRAKVVPLENPKRPGSEPEANNHTGYHSPVLKAAFATPSTEGKPKTYTLMWARPCTFQLLVQYIYRHSLPGLHSQSPSLLLPNLHSPDQTALINEELAAEMHNLAHLWFLADFFLIPRLQNLILEHFERVRERFDLVPCLTAVWNAGRMDRGNGLWRYTMDYFVWYLAFGQKEEVLRGAPGVVLMEVVVRSRERKGPPKVEDYFVKED